MVMGLRVPSKKGLEFKVQGTALANQMEEGLQNKFEARIGLFYVVCIGI